MVLAAGNPLVPNAGEFIIGLLSFGILIAVLATRAYPQIRKLYAERTERIEGGIAKAERMQAEAQRTLTAYQAQLAEARAEAAREIEHARTAAAAIRVELEAQARAEAERIRASAHEQMAAERAAVVAELRREIGTLSLDLAERILGHALDSDERQHQLIEDFIAGLEAGPAAHEAAGALPGQGG